MSRFLSTIPTNHGFVNLGLVQAYPTGGSGPIAFGPTSYFGSDPRPPELGDNLNNPIDIGNFDPLFSSQTISGTHGGLTRRQSTFYKFTLNVQDQFKLHRILVPLHIQDKQTEIH